MTDKTDGACGAGGARGYSGSQLMLHPGAFLSSFRMNNLITLGSDYVSGTVVACRSKKKVFLCAGDRI